MRFVRASAVVAIAAGAVLAGGGAASAALPGGTIGTFPTWSIGGSSNAYTGTAQFASPTLVSPTVTSDSASITVASGASAYLGAGTGFGAEFGATRAQPYLTIRPQSASPATTLSPAPAYSTTTIDFGAAGPAAGWGFAVGDIDADWVQVVGYDAGGAQVVPGDLGEHGGANYCVTTPKPSTCSGVTTFDQPNWTGTGSVTKTWTTGTITYSADTVWGNFDDTVGAYDWFTPLPSVHRIELRYGPVNGSPVFQLWIAQPAPTAAISGTLSVPGTASVPSGTSVQLESADGTPVAGLDGDPVTTPVAADGSYTITTEQRTAYQLQVLPPAGYQQPAAITVTAATAAVAAPAITMDPTPPAAPAPPRPELAESGIDPGPLPAIAIGLLVLGAAAIVVTAAVRRRARR
jgi:hypothetical protein